MIKLVVSEKLKNLGKIKRSKSETEDYKAKPNHPPGHGHKITDWEKFSEFAKQHGDKTQADMAALWQGDISTRTISRALYNFRIDKNRVLYP